MDFNGIIQRALSIRKQYREYEERNYGTSWTNEELALGFVGDVRDLVNHCPGRRTWRRFGKSLLENNG